MEASAKVDTHKELIQLIQDLQFKNRALEEENVTLKYENEELRKKLDTQKHQQSYEEKLELVESTLDFEKESGSDDTVAKDISIKVKEIQKKYSEKVKRQRLERQEANANGTQGLRKKLKLTEATEGIDVVMQGAIAKTDQENKLQRNSEPIRQKRRYTHGSEVEVNMHPLLMDAVLEILMSYLEPKDLLNSRLVCKIWKKEAEKRFQENVTFFIPSGQLNKVRKFVRCAELSFPKFQKLKLELSRYGWMNNQYDIKKIFTRHGSGLRKLSLLFTWTPTTQCSKEWCSMMRSISEAISQTKVNEIIFENLPCCFMHDFMPSQEMTILPEDLPLPNVTKVDITVEYGCGGGIHDNETYFNEMINALSNLKELHWRCNGLDYTLSGENGSGTILTALLVDGNDGLGNVRNQFENLYFYVAVDISDVNKLIDSALKLKRLYLRKFNKFELNLSTDPKMKSQIFPAGNVSEELRVQLEDALNEANVETCSELLTSFIGILDSKKNGE